MLTFYSPDLSAFPYFLFFAVVRSLCELSLYSDRRMISGRYVGERDDVRYIRRLLFGSMMDGGWELRYLHWYIFADRAPCR